MMVFSVWRSRTCSWTVHEQFTNMFTNSCSRTVHDRPCSRTLFTNKPLFVYVRLFNFPGVTPFRPLFTNNPLFTNSVHEQTLFTNSCSRTDSVQVCSRTAVHEQALFVYVRLFIFPGVTPFRPLFTNNPCSRTVFTNRPLFTNSCSWTACSWTSVNIKHGHLI